MWSQKSEVSLEDLAPHFGPVLFLIGCSPTDAALICTKRQASHSHGTLVAPSVTRNAALRVLLLGCSKTSLYGVSGYSLV